MGISDTINNFLPSDNPMIILEQAEQNHEMGNFNDALIGYLWFFDNSTKFDSSYKGAKLVRCLGNWYELTKAYKPAYENLLKKKIYLSKQLNTKPNTDDYLTFVKICNKFNTVKEAITLFKYFHETNKQFAKEIFNDIMENLLEANEFLLCENYIEDAIKLYDKQLLLLDNLLYTDKNYYNNEFSTMYIEQFLQKIEYIIKMLKITNRHTEINYIINNLKNEMKKRNIKIHIDNR